jgi:hypothetical protein
MENVLFDRQKFAQLAQHLSFHLPNISVSIKVDADLTLSTIYASAKAQSKRLINEAFVYRS